MTSDTPGEDTRESSLDELLRLVGRTASPAGLGHDVTEALCGLLGTAVVLVHALAPDGALRLVGASGVSAAVTDDLATLRADGAELAARCAATGSTAWADATGAVAVAAADRAILRAASAARLRAVPLVAYRKLRGVLTFAAGTGDGPSSTRLEAIETALGLALAAIGGPAGSPPDVLERTLDAARELTDFWAGRPYAFIGPESALAEGAGHVRAFLEVLAERARELVGAELAAVGVGTSPDTPFDPWVAVGLPPAVAEAIGRTPRPLGTLGAVAIGGETIRVRDVRQHPAFVGLPAHHPELRSLLAVPLSFRGERVGNLYLANKRGAAEFDRVDQAVAEILATISTVLTTVERDRRMVYRILDGSPDGVLFVDVASGHVLANRAFATLFGSAVAPEGGLSQELGSVLTPDGVPLKLEDLPSSRALASGQVAAERELLFMRRDGRHVAVTARAAPIRGSSGTVVGAVSTYRDVTRQHDLLATIQQERTKVRNIVEAAPDGILFVDPKTDTVLGNRAFEDLLGRRIDPGAGLAQEVGIVRWPDGKSLTMDEFPSLRALHNRERVQQELLFVHEDGRAVPVEEHAAPIFASDGTVLGVVVTCRDLSAQKELERIREEFAAMVAHDLRNPIQSILVQAQILRKDVEAGRPVKESALDRMTRIAHQMSRITSDLLDSVRIDMARVALDRSRRDTVQAVRDVVEQVQPAVGDHPIRVKAAVPVPPVLVDAARFAQILTNLLENAAKYSEGGAAIDVSVSGAGGEVEISVHDRGIGISPEELPRLFDRFYQTERARERKSGLGLGLFIAKGFVEAHGGRLTVESAVDRGSTFHVFLPATPAKDQVEGL